MFLLIAVATFLVCALTCPGVHGVASGVSLQGSEAALLVPWLQPISWRPPYGDAYNDLEALVKLRQQENWVSIFLFSLRTNRTGSSEEAAFLRLALNTLYSYRVFGQASSDIVAAITPEALAECRKLRLPCYNASKYALDARSLKNIGWAKVKLTRDVLKMGYNVHLSDLDLSYLKPIHLARQEVFSWSRGAADGSMMQEEWVYQDDPKNPATRRPIYLANTGVVFLRANSRTVAFMESLLKWEGDNRQDQHIATLVAYQSWAPCTEEASCLAARARGMAAVHLHPSQFAGSNCQPEAGYSPCAPRRLYVHAVCRSTSIDKEAFLRYTRAMFIGGAAAGGPAAGGARGAGVPGASQAPAWDDPSVLGQQDNAAVAASGLPCPFNQQRAWSGWPDVVSGVAAAASTAATPLTTTEAKTDGGERANGKKRIKQRKLVGKAEVGGGGEEVGEGGATRFRGGGEVGRERRRLPAGSKA